MTSAPSSSENITRDEARQRASIIRAESYSVTLDLADRNPTFRSTTTCVFTCTEPGATTWIDLLSERVESVTLNGLALDVAEVATDARITLPNLAARNEVTIVADCRYMNTGEGLHRFIDPVDDEVYLYTQFESADARRMYACFEQPDIKATFQLTVTAPDHWQVVSNSPSPTPVPAGTGLATWTFDPTPRMSTYITALVAGPYYVVRDSYTGPNGTYPLGVYCRTSLAEFLDPEEILTVTKQGFAFFEEQFKVPYPFAKYDQLFVPEFNAGAMENAGCVTILEDYVFRSRVTHAAYEQRANTILHELAHMWFGDLVTMRWWDDLWLNESFAEWAAHYANVHATKYTEAWTTFANLRKAWAYRQDQLPSTHPIAADMVDLDSVRVNFDGITYAKGASALRQLVAWVGEENFLAGLHTYFTKHAWGNTELADLLVELEATSGRDLSQWTREWLQTSGVNLLRVQFTLDDNDCFTSVSVIQEPPTVPEGLEPVLRSHRIGVGLYDLHDGALRLRERIEVDVQGASTNLPQLVGMRQPDLLVINDGDLTFAKVRLDERSWSTATQYLGTLEDSLARAIIWSAAWDMTRDGEVPTGEFLTLVLGALGNEPDVGVVQGVLRQLRAAIDQYATDAHREEYLIRLAEHTKNWAQAAEPGSDHQLAFARTFAGAAVTTGQLAVVAGLLDGTEDWPGLVIDTDLRWFLLTQLVIAGERDAESIDAELERDPTATGQRMAALARAAIPTSAGKEATWDQIMNRTDLPNAIIESMIAGFMDRDHVELMHPFVERYFESLPQVWESRTSEIAQSITMGLYPAVIITPEIVERTNAFLQGDLVFALRRLVTEGRDGVERALRARSADERYVLR